MSLASELQRIDCDRLLAICVAVFSGDDAEFIRTELGLADRFPALRVLSEIVDANAPLLLGNGISADRVTGLRDGVNLVKVLLAVYASSAEIGEAS